MSANISSARTSVATVDVAASDVADLGPWPLILAHARSIGVALFTCLALLSALEIGVFRSGYFAAHATVTDPQWPAAKLAVASRQAGAEILYVGDSTMMTSTQPAIVTRLCACGTGFNAGFSSANAWLTDAMTRRLLTFMHPKLVVISLSPWMVDTSARFEANDLARQLMTPSELASRGASSDLGQGIDAALGAVWSAYGQRAVLKEWLSSLAPGQRYDERLLGYYVAPGTFNSDARLVATADRLFADVGAPSSTAPSALVIAKLVDDLRARGIAVAFLLPPLHPTAYVEAGTYLVGAEAAIRELASRVGAPIVDCRSVAGSNDFRDVTHLLEPASERHSACVAEQLTGIAGH